MAKTGVLHIAKNLSLPREAATEVLAFLGRRGQGKSYAAQKLAEEFHRIGAQFVVLDPVGNWWGLRLGADGKAPGIPLPVLGGLRGDIPLESTAGGVIADLVIDRGISLVIDVSQFESDAAKARFAHDFAARFYFRKKSSPSAVHLFLEEAQEFVPQKPEKEETRMLHVLTRMAKLGRNFGIGMSLLSQRPQEVNKKVLNLAELLFVFQLAGVHERKAIEAWIADKDIDEDIGAELPKLERGKPHVWSPAWLQISEVVTVDAKWTFDASSTPKVGAASAAAKPLAPIDLEQLQQQMAATIEKAKADDPVALRKQIAELKRQVTAAERQATRTPPAPARDDAALQRAVAQAEQRACRQFDSEVKKLIPLGAQLRKLHDAFETVLHSMGALGGTNVVPSKAPEARPRPVIIPPSPVRVPRPSAKAELNGSGTLGKGELRVLTAIAQHTEGVTRDQLTVLTKYKRSTRDTYIQRLGAAGYVHVDGSLISATPEGYAALGEGFEPLPTGDALREYWLQELPEGERRVLETLIEVYPAPLTRDEISNSTEYKRSTRDTYLQRLQSRRLIDVDRGTVTASHLLFGS